MTGAPDSALARRVGAVTIAVIATAIGVFVFLLDRATLGSPTRIRVTFRHTAGLREHAALVVAGRPIGRVESIAPVPHGSPGSLGGEVGVALTVAIDEDSVWKVPARADIFVSSRGPVSDRYLEVAPPTGDPGPPVHDGQELRGIDPPSLDSVLQRTWANLTTFHDFVEAVRPDLAALRTQLGQLRTELDALGGDSRAAGGSDSGAGGGRDSGTAGGSNSGAAGASNSSAAGASDSGTAGASNPGAAGASNSSAAGGSN
ncbi:MAG TPA: MlaD family protein, partial [Kofleriaceae bacterium]|nr:MlaD family protein [Kofleriaceae bacterium]